MPIGLRRHLGAGHSHFVTFSCDGRRPYLGTTRARDLFEKCLEETRRSYGFYVSGYVVMPEHVHLMVTEPEELGLDRAIAALKMKVSKLSRDRPFWLTRYYDFNVFSEDTRVEKLRYLHRNPVVRGLVNRPEDWAWSSYRHYLTGNSGVVRVESPWVRTERAELMG